MKRLAKIYPLLVVALLAFVVFEWLKAEDAVGGAYRGQPEDGGIFGHP